MNQDWVCICTEVERGVAWLIGEFYLTAEQLYGF